METIYDKNNGDDFLSGQVLLSNSDKNESYNMDVDHHNNDLIEKPKEIFQATAPLVEDGLKNLIGDPLSFLQTSNIEDQQHALMNMNKDDLTEEKFVLDEQTDISLKNEKQQHQLNDHDHRDHDQEHDEFKQNNHHSDMGPETCVDAEADEDGALYRNDLLGHESEKLQHYEIEIGGHAGEDDEELGSFPEKEVDDMLSEDTPITEDVAGSNEHLNCGFNEEIQSNKLTPEPAAMKNSNEFLNDIIENHNKHIDELGTMPAVDGQQHFEREFEDDFHEELNVDKKIEESKTESVPPVVHESGDESEDEWRYMRLKEGDAEKQALKEILPELEAEQQQQQPPHPQSPPSQELEKADTPKEFEKSQEPSEIANSGAIDSLGNQEEEEDDDMSSQLNPEAKEFVPSSPLHFDSIIDPLAAVKTLTDEVVSQSPRKGAISMNNIKVPDENDFVTEISNRPSEIDVNLSNNSKATIESNTSVALQEEPYQEMNLKEAMHGSEKEEQTSPDEFMLNAGMMRDEIMQRSMQGEEDFFGRTATIDLMNKVQMLPVDDFEGLGNEFKQKISDFGLGVQDNTSEIVSNMTENFSNIGESLLNDFSMKNGNFNPFDQHEKQQSPIENDQFGNDFGLEVNEPVLSGQVQGDLLAEQSMIITKSLTPTPEPPVSAPKTPEPVTSAPKTPEPEQISVPATPEPQHHFSVPATPESPISIPASPEPHHISVTPEPQSLLPKSPELSIPKSPEPLISTAASEEVHQLASPVSKSPEQSCDSLEGSNLVATSPSPIEPQQIIETLIPTSPTQPSADLIVDNHVLLDEKPTEIVKQQETAEPTPAKQNILGKVAAVAVAATAAVAAGAAVAVSKAKVPDTKKPAAGAAKTVKAPAAAAPKRITSATSASSDKAKPTTAALKAKTSTTSTTAAARPRTVPSAMASSRTTKTTTTTTAAAKPKVEAKTTTTAPIKRTLVKPKIEDAAKPAAAKTLASKTGSTKTTVTSRTVGSATAQRPRTVPSSLTTTTKTTTASTRPALSPSAKTTTATKPIGSPRTTLASTLRKAETLKSPTLGTTTTAKRLTTVTKTTTVTTTSPRTATSTNVTTKTQTTRTSGGPTRTSTLTTSATKPLAKRSPAKTPTSASKAAAAAKKTPVTKSPGPIRAPEGYKMNGTVEGVNVEIKLNGSLSAEPKKD